MESNASNMVRSEKIEQLLNQQNIKFQSEIVKAILTGKKDSQTILDVTIRQKVHSKRIKTKENIFTYFESIHFNTLHRLCLNDMDQMDQMILPNINAPLLYQIFIQNVNNLSLSQFARGNYPSLKIIDASASQISQLPQLSGCSSIQKLQLSDNKLKSIEIFLKGSYPCLRILDLSWNQIGEIDKIDAENLEQLNLSGNLIYSIDKLTGKYQKLRIIQLQGNKLKSVPFINASNLQSLCVSDNQIQQFDQFYSENLTKYERLNDFECFSNSIKQIPRFLTLKNACALIYLSLSNCRIENIQILSQIELNRIESIDLSYNKITSFNIFHKLKLCQIFQIRIFGNLSYRRDFMSRCQINNRQDPRYKQSCRKKIQIDQDTIDSGYNLSWLLKYNKEKVKIMLGLNDKQIKIDLDYKLLKVFEKNTIEIGH